MRRVCEAKMCRAAGQRPRGSLVSVRRDDSSLARCSQAERRAGDIHRSVPRQNPQQTCTVAACPPDTPAACRLPSRAWGNTSQSPVDDRRKPAGTPCRSGCLQHFSCKLPASPWPPPAPMLAGPYPCHAVCLPTKRTCEHVSQMAFLALGLLMTIPPDSIAQEPGLSKILRPTPPAWRIPDTWFPESARLPLRDFLLSVRRRRAECIPSVAY